MSSFVSYSFLNIYELIFLSRQLLFKLGNTQALKAIYKETNGQVEKWSRIISSIGIEVIPLCGVLSMLLPSFFFYFTTNRGRDAFILPVPMW